MSKSQKQSPNVNKSTNASKGDARVIYSDIIGKPTFILEPDDLPPCPEFRACIQRLDDGTLVKFGRNVRLSEADAMRIVSEKTTIAVPKVITAYILDNVGYILMSFEEGERLYDLWPKATPKERSKISLQMQDYFSQLRGIKASFFGGVDHSPCPDNVFEQAWEDPDKAYGPFSSESEFNKGILQVLVDRVPPEDREQFGPRKTHKDLVKRIMSLRGHDAVLTHGDLNPANILVRPDGRVVLLDWGTSGYFPDYWEYCRAKFNPWRYDWEAEIDKFLKPCAEWSTIERLFYVMIN